MNPVVQEGKSIFILEREDVSEEEMRKARGWVVLSDSRQNQHGCFISVPGTRALQRKTTDLLASIAPPGSDVKSFVDVQQIWTYPSAFARRLTPWQPAAGTAPVVKKKTREYLGLQRIPPLGSQRSRIDFSPRGATAKLQGGVVWLDLRLPGYPSSSLSGTSSSRPNTLQDVVSLVQKSLAARLPSLTPARLPCILATTDQYIDVQRTPTRGTLQIATIVPLAIPTRKIFDSGCPTIDISLPSNEKVTLFPLSRCPISVSHMRLSWDLFGRVPFQELRPTLFLSAAGCLTMLREVASATAL